MNRGLLVFSLLIATPVFAWEPQTGDIIFQTSLSSQSQAIQLATHSDYSHTGMIVIREKKAYVFEAVGPVVYTPLQKWIKHGKDGKYIVRRVDGGLSAQQQQKLAHTESNISVNHMIWPFPGVTSVSTAPKWCGRCMTMRSE